MSLRQPTPADASSIAAISLEVWVGTYLKRGVSAFFADYALQEFTPGAFGALMADPANFMRVSDNAEGIDGVLRLSSGRDAPVPGCSEFEIATLYVQPRHHGKGIGKALLAAGLAECRMRGADSVWLTTNAENDPAIAFYLAQGFEHVGETYFRIQDQGYLNNVYSYRLT